MESERQGSGSGSELPREAASVITTRSNPRCRSRWHLRVRVLQHDGIRVGLAPYMLLCLDERGKFTGDHQNTLGLPGRPAPLGRVGGSMRRPQYSVHLYISNDWTLPAADWQVAPLQGPGPLAWRARVSLSEHNPSWKRPPRLRLGRHLDSPRPPTTPTAQVHHRTGGCLPLFNACSTVNLSTGSTRTSGC